MKRVLMLSAIAATHAIGCAATAAELQRGRLMRSPDHFEGPTFFYGPGGAQQIFHSPADVPAGWQDHPSKVKDGSHPSGGGAKTAVQPANGSTTAEAAAKTRTAKSETQTDIEKAAANTGGGTDPNAAAQTPPATDPQTDTNAGAAGEKHVELDTDGHPFDPALHAATKSKTRDGKWRMKVGVKRPDPAPGYPLDL